MFVLQGQKPICLLCYEAVLVSCSEKQNFLQELKEKLRWQQNVLTKGTTRNTAAVKASFFWLKKSPKLQSLLQTCRFEAVHAEGL